MDETTQHLVDMAKRYADTGGNADRYVLRTAIRKVEAADEQPPEIIPEGDYTVEVASSVTVALRITKGANRERLLFAPATILAPHPFKIKLSIERVFTKEGDTIERNRTVPSEGGFEFDHMKAGRLK